MQVWYNAKGFSRAEANLEVEVATTLHCRYGTMQVWYNAGMVQGRGIQQR
jgi:hypothetical protein